MTRTLVVALALACGACTIGRDYVGNTLRANPYTVLQPGKTSLAQVMEMFGAPDRVQRRRDGDILIYRFVRQNTSQLQIRTPGIGPVPAYTFFTYRKNQLKANKLALFFDNAGTLTAFGYTGGEEELDLL